MTKPSEGGGFSIAIEDRFDPTDDHVVELMSMDEYQGVSKIDGKPYTSIMWHCRIYDQDGVAFLNEIDHAPYDFVGFSSMSLAKGNKTAKAREWAGAFLGRELTDDDCEKLAENFDGALVGKRALASWKFETNQDGSKKMGFALLRPIPARMRRPTAEVNGTNPQPPVREVAPPAQPTPGRETAAQRRARQMAEYAAKLDAEDNEDDDDEPFN